MRTCVYRFDFVLMFEYDTTGYRYEIMSWAESGQSFEVLGSAGRIRGSAENNSRVMPSQPASGPLLAARDPTRPDPTRELFITS